MKRFLIRIKSKDGIRAWIVEADNALDALNTKHQQGKAGPWVYIASAGFIQCQEILP